MARMVQFAWRALVRTGPVPGRRLLIGVAAAQQIAEMGGTRLAAKRSWVGLVAASTMRYRFGP
ncbi:hypothetical protein [Actinacidiphila sp. bgisy144]|uniref:hypothetical protein n=1 Tax=unclassified Actinacidiphila TaxID=2995708 RepID=UPI003EB7ED0F